MCDMLSCMRYILKYITVGHESLSLVDRGNFDVTILLLQYVLVYWEPKSISSVAWVSLSIRLPLFCHIFHLESHWQNIKNCTTVALEIFIKTSFTDMYFGQTSYKGILNTGCPKTCTEF